jgi:hypothetical protein
VKAVTLVKWLVQNPAPPGRTFAFADWTDRAREVAEGVALEDLVYVVRHGRPDLIWSLSLLARTVGMDIRLVSPSTYEVSDNGATATYVTSFVSPEPVASVIIPGSQLDEEELIAAAERASGAPNDLVPFIAPTLVRDDLVDVVRSLKYQIEHESYRPVGAEIVRVPKPGWTTRPAAVLRFVDHVLLEALVYRLRPYVEAALPPTSRLLWPRATSVVVRPNLDDAVTTMGSNWVCVADVADFFGAVKHDRLAHLLLLTAPMPVETDMLVSLLSRMMGTSRGLPQGIAASDTLAALYLVPVDRDLILANRRYVRRVDDFRIATDDLGDARGAIYRLQETLERIGLHLNSSKTYPMSRSAYLKRVDDRREALDSYREMIRERQLTALLDAYSEEPYELMDAAGLSDEDKWDWYHERMDVEELANRIRARLQPGDADAAEAIVREAMQNGPARDVSADRERFQSQIRDGLAALVALQSAAVVDLIPTALIEYPEETPTFVTYLGSLGSSGTSTAVEALQLLVRSPGALDWQIAWLYRVLSLMGLAHEEVVARASADVEDRTLSWLRRLEAARCLAVSDQLAPGMVDAIRDMPAALAPYFRSIVNQQVSASTQLSASPLDELVARAVARSEGGSRAEDRPQTK